MRDESLLHDLLSADTENEVIAALNSRGLLTDRSRWKYLGGMPNNQSIVHAQQSSPVAALIEKYTNGLDAILLRYCKAAKIDPRSLAAPQSMAAAIEKFLATAELKANSEAPDSEIRIAARKFSEENLVLYATGSKQRPSLSIYDNGEGQLAENFESTFCSLIHGESGGSYKGAIPFVQGRFNMGSSGVLPFCSDKHKFQLIVSRVPKELAGRSDHEWAFTLLCYFPSQQDPSWHYLVGTDKKILTGGSEPMGLLPPAGEKSGVLSDPLGRKVASGTLIKMYEFKAPLSNVCGELYRKIEDFLLQPPLPLRIVECRDSYKAKVMQVTMWDRLGAWSKDKLEPGFEDGAAATIQLSTGESVPIEIRVFKPERKNGKIENRDSDQPTGLRALINGQSHAKRDTQFFKTNAVDKEHIAGSMLVLLDCTSMGQASRNALFMSNREVFRDDPLLKELLGKIQRELKNHEGLIELNQHRYEEKVKEAASDEEGVKALEELLSSEKDLAELFGSAFVGSVAAKVAQGSLGKVISKKPMPYVGQEFPTFFHRSGGGTSIEVEVEEGKSKSVSFLTDVSNNYFSRKRHHGVITFSGDIIPTTRLFDGRFTLTFAPPKAAQTGDRFNCDLLITDNKGSGPFSLSVKVVVVAAQDQIDRPPRPPVPPKSNSQASRPNIKDVNNGPDATPLEITTDPTVGGLQLLINVDSKHLAQAKAMRVGEEIAVEFVFKYGLALAAMSLIESAKKKDEWKTSEADCRKVIEGTIEGIAKVIVPMCLSLPKKLPKAKREAA